MASDYDALLEEPPKTSEYDALLTPTQEKPSVAALAGRTAWDVVKQVTGLHQPTSLSEVAQEIFPTKFENTLVGGMLGGAKRTFEQYASAAQTPDFSPEKFAFAGNVVGQAGGQLLGLLGLKAEPTIAKTAPTLAETAGIAKPKIAPETATAEQTPITPAPPPEVAPVAAPEPQPVSEAVAPIAPVSGIQEPVAETTAAGTGDVEPPISATVYHGSKKESPTFEIRPGGNEIGVHFGTAEQADWRVGDEGFVKPYNIEIQKPLRLEDQGGWYGESAVKEINSKIGSNLSPSASVKTIRETIQKAGYDGIVYKNTFENPDFPADSYIVFDKNQIKPPSVSEAPVSTTGSGIQETGEVIKPGMYHGTREQIEGGLKPGLGKNQKRFLHEEGIWFAPHEGVDFETSTISEARRYSGDSGTIVKADLKLKNPYYGDVDDLASGKINTKWLKENGYDGFVDDKSGSGFVVVLDKSQIKEISRKQLAPSIPEAPVSTTGSGIQETGGAAPLSTETVTPEEVTSNAQQISKSASVHGDVLNAPRTQESVGEVPTAVSGEGVQARGQGETLQQAPQEVAPVPPEQPAVDVVHVGEKSPTFKEGETAWFTDSPSTQAVYEDPNHFLHWGGRTGREVPVVNKARITGNFLDLSAPNWEENLMPTAEKAVTNPEKESRGGWWFDTPNGKKYSGEQSQSEARSQVAKQMINEAMDFTDEGGEATKINNWKLLEDAGFTGIKSPSIAGEGFNYAVRNPKQIQLKEAVAPPKTEAVTPSGKVQTGEFGKAGYTAVDTPAEIAAKNGGEETGIAARYREEEQPGSVIPGVGRTADEARAWGHDFINKGGNPYDVVANKGPKRELWQDVGVVRAEYERLSNEKRAAEAALESNPSDPQLKMAFDNAEEAQRQWSKDSQPVLTRAGDALRAASRSYPREINTFSDFTDIVNDHFKGEVELTPEKRSELQKAVKAIKKGNLDATEARAQVTDAAVKKAGGKVLSIDDLKTTLQDKMSKLLENCIT